VRPASKECKIQEINAINAYLQFFESEYMSPLGGHILKLDFSHSQRRDTHIHNFSSLQLALKGYLDDLVTLAKAHDVTQKESTARAQQVQRKMVMDLIVKCGEFSGGLYKFVGNLLEDHRNEGNLILNPEDAIEFDPLHGKRILNGKSVIEGLEQIRLFLGEFTAYLNVPG
jgi:hypothetical protein